MEVVEEANHVTLHLDFGPCLKQAGTRLVTTAVLGRAKIPGLHYENADGSSLKIDIDYFGKHRSKRSPTVGPFEDVGAGLVTLKVW